MIFGEVVHQVTQPAGWPEPVRGIASLLSSFHCPNKPSNENFSSASSSIISEPLASNETPAPELYTAKDFQILIHSTAARLRALGALPHYRDGSKRSTVPLWSQLIHALANTLSPDVVILEEAPFIMPRARNVSCQPENLIDGHATILVAHAIFAEPRTHSNRARTNTRNEEDQDESMCSADQDESICSADQDESISPADQDEWIYYADQDESISSADSDPCDGSVDSLDLPLQAHMLPGRGRRLSAVVPVLLVADPHNIIPLLCSALYQRHVWGIRQPVVGLCCSRTGTIAATIFGWLESDQSEEGCMPTAHLAFSADFRSDPLMGVFDFTDTSSAISLAQFILGLRTHFEDIKGATSIEAVDSLTPFHWRSDVPDFETQFWGQSDERVASWTHQVHIQMSSSEVSSSSSSTPRTPSPLLYTACVYDTMTRKKTAINQVSISVDGEPVVGKNIGRQDSGTTSAKRSGKGSKSGASNAASSAYSASRFAARSDRGVPDESSLSIWLFERHACTIGRIKIDSEPLAKQTKINAMVELYDKMTALIGSKEIAAILSKAIIDGSYSDFKKRLEKGASPNCQSNDTNVLKTEDIKFISSRLTELLNAVKGACSCDDGATSRGANEAERRHQWDSLLFNFFEPVENRQDVLLERQLNLARNLAADDSSFATKVPKAARAYLALCAEQYYDLPEAKEDSDSDKDRVFQARAARDRAERFWNTMKNHPMEDFAGRSKAHSSLDPVTGKCDAILTIPFYGGATAILQAISSVEKQAKFLKQFMLVQNPPLEKHEVQIDNAIINNRNTLPKSRATLQVPSADSKLQFVEAERLLRSLLFMCDPDGKPAPQEQETPTTTTRGTDILLPILLAEYKKMDATAISTAVNQMRMYQVSAVTFLSVLGITDQPVFGLVVTGTIGAITMAWKTNGQIYVMERNVRNYDIRDPLQALQFVSILPRLARHGADLLKLLKKPLAISDVEEWSKLYQRPADEAWLEAEKEKAEARSKEDEKRKREEEASTKADLVATESDAESEEE